MNDTSEKRSRELRAAVKRAVLDLYEHSNAASLMIPIPEIAPETYLMLGSRDNIRYLLSLDLTEE